MGCGWFLPVSTGIAFYVMLSFSSLANGQSPLFAHKESVKLETGKTITLTPRGNVYQHWLESEMGIPLKHLDNAWRPVSYRKDSGWQVIEWQGKTLSYDELLADEQLMSSVLNQVRKPDLADGLKQFNKHHAVQSNTMNTPNSTFRRSPTTSSGHVKQMSNTRLLVVLVEFENQTLSTSMEELWQTFFGSERSVQKYYSEVTKNRFQLNAAATGTKYPGLLPISLAMSHPNFGSNYGQDRNRVIRSSLEKAAMNVDFAQFDRDQSGTIESDELVVLMMLAGYEKAFGGDNAPQPNIWGHKTRSPSIVNGVRINDFALVGERHGSRPASIGIISHELGHLIFDLPDLYDRDGGSKGIGSWGLMGLGGWNSQWGQAGDSPAHLTAWSLKQIGTITTKQVTSNSQIQVNAYDDPLQIWLDPYRHHEYLLVEYRGAKGFDQSLPTQGLLVSHIDEFVGFGEDGEQNDNSTRKLVDIEEADARSDLDNETNSGDAGDLFPGNTSKDQMTPFTTPDTGTNDGRNSGVELRYIDESIDSVSYEVNFTRDAYGRFLGMSRFNTQSSVIGYLPQMQWDISLPEQYNQVDGVDLYLASAGTITITIEGDSGEVLYQHSEEQVSSGWNRILFTDVVEADALTMDIHSTAAWEFSMEACDQISVLADELPGQSLCVRGGVLLSDVDNPVQGSEVKTGGVIGWLFVLLSFFFTVTSLQRHRLNGQRG